jgi:putative nucleotidyltransferase with HDIG domain
LEELLQDMLIWVETYIKTFYTEDEVVHKNILLKEEHTKYVVEHSQSLAKVLNFNHHDEILAMMIGLFHDIGRFKQYSIYKTFNDRRSENHALLGLKEIASLDLLNRLSDEDREVFTFAIANHNAIEIAETKNERVILFAKVIRDADKLDIYRVLEPTLEPSDGTGYSDKFIQSFLNGQQCDYSDIKTQDDRKLVRLLWIYNIYFAWTIREIIALGHVEHILSCLPKTEITQQGIEKLEAYMLEKAKVSE